MKTLTSFNYCMDANEPFRAETNTSLGNHLPSGYDNQYEQNELKRLEMLRKSKAVKRKRVKIHSRSYRIPEKEHIMTVKRIEMALHVQELCAVNDIKVVYQS